MVCPVPAVSNDPTVFPLVNNPQRILFDALVIVKNKYGHEVQFLQQPNHHKNAPFDIKNLCELALSSGKRIGDVNIVKWKQGVYNHEKREREIERYYTADELAEIIKNMVQGHLFPNAGVLVTSSGSRFNIKHLTHSLEINSQGYFQLDGFRLWTMVWKGYEKPLLAASLRGHTLIELKEQEGRIEFQDKDDPAPPFFIDLTQRFTPQGSDESFYLFCRDSK
jgi:hypothetical protein